MVGPMLQIHSIPIELSIRTTPGVLEYSRENPQMQISRQMGGLTVDSTLGKLHIDTFEARNSINPTAIESIKQSAQQGRQVALDAAASYAQQGKRAMEVPIGEEAIIQFVVEAQFRNVKTNTGIRFIPTVPPKISYTPGHTSIQFEADHLQFQWRIGQQHFNYTPGRVDIEMTQRPDVEIKYTGGFTYVPRSSDPNYRPIDIQV